jgi:RNA polymerase sigma factor (TIGR02999 family)
LARERQPAPLSPTELIHEIWLRSFHGGGWQVRDRDHFYSIAAQAMRHVLVDFARARVAEKRGGGIATLSLNEARGAVATAALDQERIIEIGILMERLEHSDPMAALLIDLHYFAGFTLEEAADVMKLSLRQARQRWSNAKTWLQKGLSG